MDMTTLGLEYITDQRFHFEPVESAESAAQRANRPGARTGGTRREKLGE